MPLKTKTSISAFDWFSIGHFAFGLIAYLIIILLLPCHCKYVALGLTIAILLAWDILENTLGLYLKWKKVKDSWANFLADLLLGFLGAFLLFAIF